MMRKKIILLIGIIVTISFSIGYITSILINNGIPNDSIPNDDIPKFYIATDDMQFINSNPRLDINQSTIRIGYYGQYIGPNYIHDFLIKFNLTNKPQNWIKCEIQIYKYSVHPSPMGNPLLRLLLGSLNWTDETIDWRYNDLYQYWN